MGSAVKDEFDLAGHALSDRYDIERVVACGGFGVVYFGRHRALKSPIAVKVLRTPKELTAAEEKQFAERFLAEAQTIAELHHAAVVRALDFGVTAMPNGMVAPWTVFEWVEGQTLKDFLDARRGQPMAPRDALNLLKPVFEGLATAHAMGIAHRDVKPANIMLPRGTSGLASRILDFGIAKTMDADEAQAPTGQTRTRSGASGFSLLYASPEQIGNTRTGPWTDVHALGLVLTEALVGRAPYEGQDFVDIASAVLSAERPTPAHFGVDVGDWEPVLQRALSMKPSGRFANAADFLAALETDAPYDTMPITGLNDIRRLRASTAAASPLSDSTLRPSLVPVTPSPAARSRWVLPGLLALSVASVGALAVNVLRSPTAADTPAPRPAVAPPQAAPPVVHAVPASPPAEPSAHVAEPPAPQAPAAALPDASTGAVVPVAVGAMPPPGGRTGRRSPRAPRDADAAVARPPRPVEIAPNI